MLIFLSQKKYESIVSNANFLFGEEDSYEKRIWIIKEYKQRNGEITLIKDENKISSFAQKSHDYTFNNANLDENTVAFNDEIIESLKNKVKQHNVKSNNKITLTQLKKVYRRGMGAFSNSNRLNASNQQLAMARVNMFLKMAKGEEVKDSYRKADEDIIDQSVFSYEIKDNEFILSLQSKQVDEFIDDIDDEFFEEEVFERNRVSYSINKKIINGEYIIDLIENIEYKDNFNYFSKSHIDSDTGDQDLDIILAAIYDSEFNEDVILDFLNDDIDNNNLVEEHIGSMVIQAKKTTQDKIDEVYKKYHDTVNMSYSALKKWSENSCSRAASLSRAPINRNLNLLSKKKEEWTMADVRSANRTISFVSRMRGAEQGEPVNGPDDQKCPSKRDISLKNWAYSP
jgi:hypothetical protein